jgi:O-antigen biosynthesis protein
MTPQRLAGAPRLIEWTGERCVPWAPDPPVIYEHFHRYLFASRLVEGRDVLDLASGEGFGAALLADSARSVVGVDIEPQAVEHSRRNYAADNLEFKMADARELASFERGSFGAVVAFEMIEHLAEHDQVLAGINQVLAPDGLLIMSTPDRTAYSDATGFQNPFHVRELSLEELLALLQGAFTNVAAWAQRTITGSAIIKLGDAGEDSHQLQRFVIERLEREWRLAPGISPMYVIAVASNGELPNIPSDSVLVDPGQELLRAAEGAQARAESSEREARGQLESAQQERAKITEAVESERRLTAELQARAAGDERIIGRLQSELAHEHRFRAGVEGSVTWRLFQRARGRLYKVLGGRESPIGKLLQAVLRRIGRPMMRARG